MSEWKEVRLGDICEIFAGGDAPKGRISKTKTEQYNIPIYSNGITEEGLYGYTDKAKVYVPATTITARGTIGVVFKRKVPYFPIVRLISLIGDKNIINSDFLYYSLRNTYISGEGSVQAQLTVPMISNYIVTIPSLTTQHRIASILSSLDDKIAVNRRICENLEAQAQALFKHWFIDFAPFKDGKFVESELGMIPEGWKVGKLSDLGDIICGKTPSKANKLYYGGNVPFIKIPDMHGNMFVINSEDNLSNEGSNSQLNKLIPEFSIMVSCIATVGLVSMNTKPSHTNQQINTIVPYVPSYRYYIYENLKLREKELLLLGSSGTTTYNVNTKTFSSLKILMPDLKVIEDFDKSIKYHFEETLNLYQENLRLSTLRDTLLPKLMSGQIKV